MTPEEFRRNYDDIEAVNCIWNGLAADTGRYDWPDSTYISFPPFVEATGDDAPPVAPLTGLRPLVILGDSVTTYHISPSGIITPDS